MTVMQFGDRKNFEPDDLWRNGKVDLNCTFSKSCTHERKVQLNLQELRKGKPTQLHSLYRERKLVNEFVNSVMDGPRNTQTP